MFKKVTKQMIERCTKALEFYDEHGHLPYEKKKVLVNISYEAIENLEEEIKEMKNGTTRNT